RDACSTRTTPMAKKQTDDKGAPEKAPAAEQGAPAAGAAETKKRESKPKAKPDAAPAAQAPAPAEGQPTQAPAPSAGEPTKKKGRKPGTPPRRGKKIEKTLKDQKSRIAKAGLMPLKQALQMLKTLRKAKFDETVEVHMSLGIDTTQSEQMIRGAVSLPHGVGKAKRVVVFCQGDNVAKAKEAGADMAGSDELIKKIQGENWLDFDVALAMQDMMGQVSRLGKTLGPRGLMPTPKAGTVIAAGQDLAAAVREFKAGKVEYRTDKGGNVHAGVGKMSFDDDKLAANITTFVEQIRHAKP